MDKKLKQSTVFQFMRIASRSLMRTVWIYNSPGHKRIYAKGFITFRKMGYKMDHIQIYSDTRIKELIRLTTPPGHA